MPRYMRDTKIVTLYKNKRDHRDCKNYRRICLLTIVEKAYVPAVLNKLNFMVEHLYPDAQTGFSAASLILLKKHHIIS